MLDEEKKHFLFHPASRNQSPLSGISAFSLHRKVIKLDINLKLSACEAGWFIAADFYAII